MYKRKQCSKGKSPVRSLKEGSDVENKMRGRGSTTAPAGEGGPPKQDKIRQFQPLNSLVQKVQKVVWEGTGAHIPDPMPRTKCVDEVALPRRRGRSTQARQDSPVSAPKLARPESAQSRLEGHRCRVCYNNNNNKFVVYLSIICNAWSEGPSSMPTSPSGNNFNNTIKNNTSMVTDYLLDSKASFSKFC